MQRYFIKDVPENHQLLLQGEIFHHLKHVMRNTIGDTIYLVDPNKTTYEVKIADFLEDEVLLSIVQTLQELKEMPIELTIASGFPKGEKLEWLVQKATELGMHSFIGFPSQTSVVKWDDKKRSKKQQRLEKIALEASQQSQRIVTPKVELLGSFKELLQLIPTFDYVLIAYEESSKKGEKANLKRVFQEVPAGKKVLGIFGPEGGITPSEIEAFKELGAIPASLGPRILRTETAPLYFLSAASYEWELG